MKHVHLLFFQSSSFHLWCCFPEQLCLVLDAYFSPSDILTASVREDNYGCIVMGVVLHYFFLAQFMWMVVQVIYCNFRYTCVHTQACIHVCIHPLENWKLYLLPLLIRGNSQIDWGRNSSVSSVLRSLSCVMQCCWFDCPLNLW